MVLAAQMLLLYHSYICIYLKLDNRYFWIQENGKNAGEHVFENGSNFLFSKDNLLYIKFRFHSRYFDQDTFCISVIYQNV